MMRMQNCPACDGGRIVQNTDTCGLCGGVGQCTKAEGAAWHGRRRATKPARELPPEFYEHARRMVPPPAGMPTAFAEAEEALGFDPVKAYVYEQLMIRTKCEAEARIRADFQARWGSFQKCSTCGARVDGEQRLSADGITWISLCCSTPVLKAGYSRP